MKFQRVFFRFLVFFYFCGFYTACGDSNNIAEEISPRPSQDIHTDYQESWSRDNCYACHPLVKLHVYSPNPFLDLAQIRQMVERDGLNSCPNCHYNGTAP